MNFISLWHLFEAEMIISENGNYIQCHISRKYIKIKKRLWPAIRKYPNEKYGKIKILV